MNKILITYGTQPFAQRVGRLLSSAFTVVYASSELFPDLLLKQSHHRIPRGSHTSFAHEILKLCLDQGIEVLLPLGKMEVKSIHEARVLFEEYGISVLLPRYPENCLMLEQPIAEVRVLKLGKDILTGEQLCDPDFSGVGMLSDSDEEPVWCVFDGGNN